MFLFCLDYGFEGGLKPILICEDVAEQISRIKTNLFKKYGKVELLEYFS